MNFVFSAYELSNPKYTRYQEGSGFYSSSSEVDEDFCNQGQDFLVQISPFGCSPSVVRTDLLEEQNVPVFCPLSAIKVNPLIKVNAIENIGFKGEYSEYVQDIGFNPAKVALGSNNDLNSPTLNNIGYVVIVLNEQENASNVPDYVSGNLTATIKYDIENAFGIGDAEFYLPELSESEFEKEKNLYSFWNGKGFIRAENIDDNSVVFSLYDDTERLNRFKLKKGETSGKLSLPGFDCLAGLNAKLVSLENPNTRARFNINGEIIEISEGEEFLEGRCSLRDINKKGLVQSVKINCEEDDNDFFNNKNINLEISPRITLNIDGSEKDFVIGDKITELGNGEKSLYLGYIGEDEKGKYIIPVVSPSYSEDDFKKSTFYKTILPSSIKAAESNTGNFYTNALKNILVSIGTSGAGFTQFLAKGDFILPKVYIGKSINDDVDYKEEGIQNKIKKLMSDLDKKIVFKDMALPIDTDLSQEVNNYYEKAKQDYNTVLSDFSDLKYPEESKETQGEKALSKLIDLSNKLNQKSSMIKYCEEFKKEYSDSYDEKVKQRCENVVKLANSKISNKNVMINGDLKNINFMSVYEPGIQEYNAQFKIRNPYGEERIVTLGKDSKLNMMYTISSEEENVYVIDDIVVDRKIVSDVVNTIYFRYDNNEWYWTYPGEKWVGVKNQEIERDGNNYNFPKNIWELREKFIDEDLEGGLELIEKHDGYRKYSNDYIQLDSLDEDGAILDVNLESEKGLGSTVKTAGTNRISGKKVLKKDEVVSFGSEYSFELVDVTLKKQAKVQIIPRIDNEETKANFSFKIGIEKRAIDLSTDEIKKRIDSLNSTINEWSEKSDELGKVVKSLKGACLVAGVGLTAKNFFANFGGEGIARKEQMEYWNDRCSNEMSNEDSEFYKYYSEKKLTKHIEPNIENCYDYYSDDIEESVDIRNELMNEQDKQLEDCENQEGVITSTSWLGTKNINSDKLADCYINDDYKDKIQE
ncbi:MAG: hypothetical protein ACOC3V_02050, partial [bacterium]